MKKNSMKFPWHLFVALTALFCLGLSVTSTADTYNFYFKKKGAETDEEEEDTKTSAPQTVTAPAGPAAPVVIHNVNNNNVGGQGQSISSPSTTATGPTSLPAAPVTAAVPPSPVAPEGNTTLSASLSGQPANPSRWRLGVSSTLLFQPYSHESSYGTYIYRQANWGGLVSLAYHFSESVALNAYGGLRYSAPQSIYYGHFGTDLEFTPFRIGWSERFNFLELGFLVGGSTHAKASDNIGSLHAGARVNINLGSEFGLSGVGRINLGYVMFEAGITTRL